MRLKVALGLWPEPAKTPLNAKIYGKTVRDGFTIEKVYFESFRSLCFRFTVSPRSRRGEATSRTDFHGHGGRMQDHGDKIGSLIDNGDEKYENSDVSKIGSLCPTGTDGMCNFHLRYGGYVDSLQIPMEVSHRLNDQDQI